MRGQKIFESQDDGEFEIFEVDDMPKTSPDTKVRPMMLVLVEVVKNIRNATVLTSIS